MQRNKMVFFRVNRLCKMQIKSRAPGSNTQLRAFTLDFLQKTLIFCFAFESHFSNSKLRRHCNQLNKARNARSEGNEFLCVMPEGTVVPYKIPYKSRSLDSNTQISAFTLDFLHKKQSLCFAFESNFSNLKFYLFITHCN